MPCPNSARERSVTIGFRVTPEQARRIRSAGEVDEGLAWTVDFLAREFSAMRGEAEPSDVEREDALIFGMSRR